MTLAELALAALLTFPTPRGETPEDFSARMGTIAAAIETAVTATPQWRGTDVDLALVLVVQARFEGGLLRRVHAGQCHPGECDWVQRGPARWQGYHRARSLWQLHATPMIPYPEWRTLGGTDLGATTRAATAAARVLAEGLRRCRTLYGAISWYARPRSCSWRPAYQRTWAMERLRRRWVPSR